MIMFKLNSEQHHDMDSCIQITDVIVIVIKVQTL